MHVSDAISLLMLLNSTTLPLLMYLVYKLYDISNMLGKLTNKFDASDKTISHLEVKIENIEKSVSSHENRIVALEKAVVVSRAKQD